MTETEVHSQTPTHEVRPEEAPQAPDGNARGKLCILNSLGWGVRNVLMSKAMDVIRDKYEILILSCFSRFEAFCRRFSHLGPPPGEIIWGEPSRMLTTVYRWHTWSFYKISPSATHQYKVNRSNRDQAKEELQKKEREEALPVRAGGPEKNGQRSPLGSLLRKRGEQFRGFGYRKLDDFLRAFTTRWGGRRTYRFSRQCLRAFIRRDRRYAHYRRYLLDQRVQAVITANPLEMTEYPALLAAEDLGLRTIAIITSWDNLSSKRPLIVSFDDYAVWNSIMAREVQYFYRVKREHVHEIGPLQFDHYFNPANIEPRPAFCRRLGLDPARKIVVYSAVTKALLPDEPQIIERLLLAFKEGRVTGTPNLLIRTHPKRPLDDFRPVMEDPRWKGMNVAWTEAGRPVRKERDLWCPLDEEIRLLTSTVHHTDANLNCFSTMMLDCAILDKPAVLICHDSQDRRLHYEIYEHLQPVLACKGNRIGYCLDQTLEYLNLYLEHPELDTQGRQAMVETQCGEFLGHAWQRLVELVLQDRVGEGRESRAAARPAGVVAKGRASLLGAGADR